MLRRLRATSVVALVAGSAGFVSALPASAVARSVSMSTSVASLAGNGGGSTTITAGVPVAAPGTVSQSITQSFDPSRAQLTGSAGIVAPAGWTLTYSSDGTTFGAAPNSPAGWAAIRAVKATGSINSGGDAAGLQIASGTGTGSVPVSGAFSSGGGGDGWDVAFDEQGNVYNTFHHDGAWNGSPGFSTPGLHCHTRTGGSCGPGWPFLLRVAHGVTGPDGVAGQPWYHTGDQAYEWVDTVNNRVWVPTSREDSTHGNRIGFVCVDVSNLTAGPSWCTGDIHDAFVELSTSNYGRNGALGLAAANGKLFTWDRVSAKLLCMDPFANRAGGKPGAPCASQPFTIQGVTGATENNEYSLFSSGGLVWGSGQSQAMCFDPSGMAMCAGWSSGSVTLTGTTPNVVFDIPTSTGLAGAVCFARTDASRGCFAADGSSSTQLTGQHTGAAFMSYLTGKMTTTAYPKHGVTSGTRIYWADTAWAGGGYVYCWDTSLSSGTGAACANWPKANSAYTATIDAQNPNCIWTNTDSGAITTIDAVTGGSTCVTPPPLAEFSAPLLLPRIACTTQSSIQSWRTFKLTAPLATTYSTATLTVLTATGQILSGWNRVSIPAGNRTVDLSSLSVGTSGYAPRFRIQLNDKTTNDAIQGEVSAVGNSPELCLPLQAVAACPAGPARVSGAIPTPAPIVVTGTGEAQPGSGPVEQFAASTTSINVSAPADSTCLGSITGTASMASSSAAVPGAVVRLVDATGVVVATTTTDSSGNYTFDRLIAGSGYRVSFGPSAQGAADNTTVASAGTDRAVTANSVTTVNGSYALLRTNALTGSAAHNQPVTVTPAPNDSTGAQTYGSFTKASTCVFDPADRQCKSSVSIQGQGSWAVNSATGAISFTPVSGYSGTTSALDYRVTETSSGWTTWNTLQATIAPAPTTTTTTSLAASVSTTGVSVVVPTASSVSRAASVGTVATQVAVPSAGRVTQTGTSANLVACTATPVNARGAGTVTTRCALTWPIRNRLNYGPVTVTLVTKFKGKDGTVRTTRTRVTLPRKRMLPVTR